MSPFDQLESLFSNASKSSTLENGLRFIHEENFSAPLFSIQVWVKTGSIHEGALLGSGISHYLEHMLFKGTSTRKVGEIAQEIQSLGCNINAYTSFDRTVYFIDGPNDSAEKAIEILADMMFNATLDEKEFNKEQDVILREIDMSNDDPDRKLSRSVLSTAFRSHPYRFPVIGLKPIFKSIQHSDLKTYYKKRYIPNNMVVTASGSILSSEVNKLIGNYFGNADRKPIDPIMIPAEDPQIAFRQTRNFEETQICRGSIAFKIPSMRHDDSPSLDILAAILGSGHSGLLRKKFKDEEALVHSISASAWNPGQRGLFWISFQSDPERANTAEKSIIKYFEALADNPLPKELINKAQRFALMSELQSRQTASSMAAKLGLLEAIVGDLNYPQAYFDSIQKTTSESLQNLARKYFKRSQLTTCSVNSLSQKPKPKARKTTANVIPFEEIKLSNGARIIYQVDPRLPQLNLRFNALGGPLTEQANWKGSTSLLATLMTKDTKYRSESEVADELESVGGFMHEAAGNNTFSISVDLLSSDYAVGLKTLEEAILHPNFSENTLEREKKNQIAHIKEAQDEILYYGRRVLRHNFFAPHPFSSEPDGEINTIQNLSREIIQSSYQRLVVGPNAVIVACGDFDQDIVIPRLEAILTQLPHLPSPNFTLGFDGPSQIGNFSEFLPKEQTVVFDAFPDCGICSPDYLAGEVIDEILSSMSGPLFTKVREDNSLAYYVGSNRTLGQQFGMFSLYAGTQPETAAQVQSVFEEELNRFRQGSVSSKEIADAKNHLKTRKLKSLQTLSSKATTVALNALYNKPIEDWNNYDEQLATITDDSIQAFASNYLDESKRIRLIVQPSP